MMSENLSEWLAPYRVKNGALFDKDPRKRIVKIVRLSDVTWKRNALRHSFGKLFAWSKRRTKGKSRAKWGTVRRWRKITILKSWMRKRRTIIGQSNRYRPRTVKSLPLRDENKIFVLGLDTSNRMRLYACFGANPPMPSDIYPNVVWCLSRNHSVK